MDQVIDVGPRTLKWTRSSDGVLAGVSKGLGETFDIEPGIIRIFWLVSVIFGGVGVLIYIGLALALPLESKQKEALQPKVFGVCLRLSEKADIEIGLVRFLMLASFLFSFGLTFLAYLVGAFLLKD